MENGGGPAAGRAFKTLMDELFEGPGAQDGMFLSKGSGIFPTLEKIDAESASKEIEGSSVAAHAGHLLLYLEVLGGFLRGEVRTVDWEGRWKHRSVNKEDWDAIRSAIRDAVRSVEKGANQVTIWDADQTTMAMSLAIHSAYHLGAIRQIAKHI